VRPFSARRSTGAFVLMAMLVIICIGGLFLPTTATADNPFRLASQIEDRAAVLGDRQQGVRAALDSLQTDERVQLWVVYVDSFSGMGAQDWADETAIKSDLGLRDILLAVAVRDRAYAYSVDQSLPLTQEQLDEVMTVAVEPALSQNDWAGATVGAAMGMKQALTGTVVTTGTIQPGPPPVDGGFPLAVVIVVIIVIIVIALVLWLVTRRARTRGGAQAAGSAAATGAESVQVITIDELRREANAQLVKTDDAIKTSTEELGFVIAQFGEEQAAPFRQAVAEAKKELNEAFSLQRRLDKDADEQEQRQTLTALLAHTTAANEKLDVEAERFDKLRDLENQAPAVLNKLDGRLTELESLVPKTRESLSRLAAKYSPEALASVVTNPDEAVSRITFAREQTEAGHEDITKGRRGEATIAVLAAQEAAGQAQMLLDAVDRLGTDLDNAQVQIQKAIAETRRDIAEAQAAGTAANLSSLVAAAQRAVDAATEAAAADGRRNPLVSLRHLEDADAALERALQDVRKQHAQREKAAAALDRTLLAARAQISATDDYITTHRGAVGSGPRAALAEAQQLLNQAVALSVSDPVSAVKSAAAAHQLADSALNQARNEYAQSTGMGGLGEGGDFDSSMAGAILGGILAGILGGDSSRDRGGGSRGFGPASFGGSGTRMRRGGGGRF
jgi:uncharacterized membrane protein YgcG